MSWLRRLLASFGRSLENLGEAIEDFGEAIELELGETPRAARRRRRGVRRERRRGTRPHAHRRRPEPVPRPTPEEPSRRRRRREQPIEPERQGSAEGGPPAGTEPEKPTPYEGPRTASFFTAGRVGGPDLAQLLVAVETSLRTQRRIGIYMESVRRVLDGRLGISVFQHRFRRWRPIRVLGPLELAGEWRLLLDISAIAALANEARAADLEWVFGSPPRRPARKARR